MQIGELEVMLQEGKEKTFTPEILEIIAEYFPRFTAQRQGPAFTRWLNEKYGTNFSHTAIAKRAASL